MPDCTERYRERQYGEEISGTTQVFTGTIAFDVINSATESDALAKLPFTIGSDHDVYGGLLTCTARLPEKRGFNYWIVRCLFRSDSAGGGTTTTIPEYRWGVTLSSEEVDRDVVGNPITNSVGDPSTTPQHNDIKTLTLTWEQYELSWDPRKAVRYVDTVNEDTVTVNGAGWASATFLPGEIYCANYAPSGSHRQGQVPVRVAYEFQFRARIELEGKGEGGDAVSAFDGRFKDMGNRGKTYISGTGDRRGAFWNPLGEIIEPIPLDGHGRPIDLDVGVGPSRATPKDMGKPKGMILDKRFEPDAVWICWQRKLARPFKNLIRIF